MDTHAIMGEVHAKDQGRRWLTVVYGPQSEEAKEELTEQWALCPGPWLVLGDFNMIMRAEEKNNTNINRRMMAKFRTFANRHELKDLYLHGRKYTWSNERRVPMMTRTNCALVSVDWNLNNPCYKCCRPTYLTTRRSTYL